MHRVLLLYSLGKEHPWAVKHIAIRKCARGGGGGGGGGDPSECLWFALSVVSIAVLHKFGSVLAAPSYCTTCMHSYSFTQFLFCQSDLLHHCMYTPLHSFFSVSLIDGS